jgi:hypothetical protein
MKPPPAAASMPHLVTLAEITSAVKRARVVSVVGPPGCGKSYIALLWQARNPEFPARMVFGAGLGDPLSLLIDIAWTFEMRLRTPDSVDDLIGAIAHLAPQRMRPNEIFIIDEWSHLGPAALVVLDKLRLQLPALRLLLVDRKPTGMAGEAVVKTKPESKYALVKRVAHGHGLKPARNMDAMLAMCAARLPADLVTPLRALSGMRSSAGEALHPFIPGGKPALIRLYDLGWIERYGESWFRSSRAVREFTRDKWGFGDEACKVWAPFLTGEIAKLRAKPGSRLDPALRRYMLPAMMALVEPGLDAPSAAPLAKALVAALDDEAPMVFREHAAAVLGRGSTAALVSSMVARWHTRHGNAARSREVLLAGAATGDPDARLELGRHLAATKSTLEADQIAATLREHQSPEVRARALELTWLITAVDTDAMRAYEALRDAGLWREAFALAMSAGDDLLDQPARALVWYERMFVAASGRVHQEAYAQLGMALAHAVSGHVETATDRIQRAATQDPENADVRLYMEVIGLLRGEAAAGDRLLALPDEAEPGELFLWKAMLTAGFAEHALLRDAMKTLGAGGTSGRWRGLQILIQRIVWPGGS